MSQRRVADPDHPGVTAPVSTSEVRRVTTVQHPPRAQTYASPAPEPVSSSALARAQSSAMGYSELYLQPATRTSVVTTTTTTTVHFAPILIPRTKAVRPSHSSFSHHPRPRTASTSTNAGNPPLTPKSSFATFIEQEERRHADASSSALRLDPKMYPLSQVPWPGGLKKFKMSLGGVEGTFFEDSNDRGVEEDEELDGDESVAERQGDETATRTESGKGKERASSYSMASGSNLAQPFVQTQPAPPAAPRTPRGAPTRSRRGSRRARTSIATSFGGSLADDMLEEDDEDEVTTHGGPSGRLASPGPPRKRPRAGSRDRSISPGMAVPPPLLRDSSLFGAGALGATLPSPNQSPPSPVPTFAGGEDSQECKEEDIELGDDGGDEEQQFDLGSGAALSGLLSLPHFVEQFDQLSPALQSYFIFTFLKRSSIPVLQTINNIIAPSLRRDFLTDLPPELGVQILGYLDAQTLCRASVVCKGWRRLVDGEWRVWKERLVADELWIGDGSEEREAREIVSGSKEALFLKRWNAGVWDDVTRSPWPGKIEDDGMHVDGAPPSPRRIPPPIKLASPSSSRESSPFPLGGHYVHPFKTLYRRRFITRRNWAEREPSRVTFACHANNVVTCLQFDKDKIVSASDDHSINVFDTRTGATKARLSGHDGGVWALQYIGNILVSGSTDRTVRIWDLEKGKCTHVFVGHTSTVRCLQIVEPENINPDPNGEPIWEPPCPLIVTGSRDWSLRVWKLPAPGRDNEYHPSVPMSPTEENTDPSENPFHLRHLQGHKHAVRALAAHGRTLVSGSYDCTVRVWDILTGECKHKLQGHTQKVYSVVFDHVRKQCASGSMDGTVRLWSTETGEQKATLEGHSSLVGLLGLSYRSLVSAAADSTLRIWDPVTGECRHSLAAHSGAITCFQHDEYKVISGSDGTLKMWDVRDGSFTRDLLTGLTGVWQVSFNDRVCVAAVQRNGQSEFDVLSWNDDLDEEEDEVVSVKQEEEETRGPLLPSEPFPPTTPNPHIRALASGSGLRVVRRHSSSRNLREVAAESDQADVGTDDAVSVEAADLEADVEADADGMDDEQMLEQEEVDEELEVASELMTGDDR
ncbi:cell division control protein Cdc4 [Pseudohyphozyma bogoriensis]|nr:cell division control protein Cdc4 [Pseudohyphozyma bogoriensis]